MSAEEIYLSRMDGDKILIRLSLIFYPLLMSAEEIYLSTMDGDKILAIMEVTQPLFDIAAQLLCNAYVCIFSLQ